jgi:hypothetical protein
MGGIYELRRRDGLKCAMIYIPSFMKIVRGIQKLTGGGDHRVGSIGAPSRWTVFIRGTSTKQWKVPKTAGRNTKATVNNNKNYYNDKNKCKNDDDDHYCGLFEIIVTDLINALPGNSSVNTL